MGDLQEIPGPAGLPFVGSLYDIDRSSTINTQLRWHRAYGPIVRVQLKNDTVFVGTVELIQEVDDETKFEKAVHGPIRQIRDGMGDGLFTAETRDSAWLTAHRILIPALGPLAIRGMFPLMADIASQLATKWCRYGSKNVITPTDDFTRLTLDTLALCAFDYRLNSFYEPTMHPFVTAMLGFLRGAGEKSNSIQWPYLLNKRFEDGYRGHIRDMHALVDDIIASRTEDSSDVNDLLNAMLKGRDPKTGAKLSEENIRYQLVTFLIAGHETTSGLLSFVFYYLLDHPEAYRKVQEEVDSVIGMHTPVTMEHLDKLKYVDAVLKETLRLQPIASGYSLKLKEGVDETVIGGKYKITKGMTIQVCLPALHTDPKVWGDDANEFKPERMLDGKFEALPRAAWRPFGNGLRACIGRQFAWQEALLTMATTFQSLEFRKADPDYTLQIVQTLTIKPADFQMHATARRGASFPFMSGVPASTNRLDEEQSMPENETLGSPLAIYFGSNTGTCQTFASRLASHASRHGFTATIASLDAGRSQISSDIPVVIITASYNGQPPENGKLFIDWLENQKDQSLAGVRYAVFGCGHHDWAATFHRIPRLCDDRFQELGATRLAPLGLGDAGSHDLFGEFEAWEETSFWPAAKPLSKSNLSEDQSLQLSVQVVPDPRADILNREPLSATVIKVETLTSPGEPVKTHLELEMPDNAEYQCGEYLGILPKNPPSVVNRALKRLGLEESDYLIVKKPCVAALPTDSPVSALDLLSIYVELQDPASRSDVSYLASHATNEQDKQNLNQLLDQVTSGTGPAHLPSVLSLLEKYPCIEVAIGQYLGMLNPMRSRQYSISSSPLHRHNRATLTLAVFQGKDASYQSSRLGVASNYLARLQSGDKVKMAVIHSKQFRLPADPVTPLVLVCAGSGVAPFRGFIQERALQIQGGRSVGQALLFIGCRRKGSDALYAEEFLKWEALGAVKVFYAYSREPEKGGRCKYVQDLVWDKRSVVKTAFDSGAKVYVCGHSPLAKAVQGVFVDIYKSSGEVNGEEADSWWQQMRNERYVVDVFD